MSPIVASRQKQRFTWKSFVLTIGVGVRAACAVGGVAMLCGCGDKDDAAQAQTTGQAQAPSATKGAAPGAQPAQGMHGKGKMPGGEGAPGGMEAPATAIAAQPALRDTVRSYYVSTATLEAEKVAQILARVEGPIAAIHCEEGDDVRAGATLLEIDDGPYRIRHHRSETSLATEQQSYDRSKGMHEREMVSDGDLELAESKFQLAAADRDLAALELSYTKIAAPFAGKITRRLVNVGQTGTSARRSSRSRTSGRCWRACTCRRRRSESSRGAARRGCARRERRKTLGRAREAGEPGRRCEHRHVKVTVEVTDFPPDTRPGDFVQVRIVTGAPGRAAGSEPRDLRGSGRATSSSLRPTASRRAASVRSASSTRRTPRSPAGVEAGELVVVKGQRSLATARP